MARPREFTWSLNRPPSQREGALSFAHLVTVPIILTNECCCCSRFTGEKTGSAKIKLQSHSLWDLPAAGLYFSVSEMGLTRMPCSEPRSRHPQGLGHASSSSVSSSHRQRKAGGSRGFKFPPSLFSVILPGSSALAAWIVGCGAWGVRHGAESSRSQPKHCLWRSGTQRGSMCSWRRRGVSGASLVRPGAVAQPRPGPSSTAQAFFQSPPPPRVSAVPQGRASCPGRGEDGRRFEGYSSRGAVRGAASPECRGRGCVGKAGERAGLRSRLWARV